MWTKSSPARNRLRKESCDAERGAAAAGRGGLDGGGAVGMVGGEGVVEVVVEAARPPGGTPSASGR